MALPDAANKIINQCYKEVPRHVPVTPKPKGALRVQMAELWSFVDDKDNKQWVWLALDASTRELWVVTLVIVPKTLLSL